MATLELTNVAYISPFRIESGRQGAALATPLVVADVAVGALVLTGTVSLDQRFCRRLPAGCAGMSWLGSQLYHLRVCYRVKCAFG